VLEKDFRTADGVISLVQASNDGPTPLGEPTTLSATADAVYAAYTWNLGDGQLRSGQVITYTYAEVGQHEAVVTATNPVGTASASTFVLIITSSVYVPLLLRQP
jgi:PKD repeat protein